NTFLTGPSVAGTLASQLTGNFGTVTNMTAPPGYRFSAVDLTFTASAADEGQVRTLHWNLNRYAYAFHFSGPPYPPFPGQLDTHLDGFVNFSSGMQLVEGATHAIRQTSHWLSHFEIADSTVSFDTSNFMSGIDNPFDGLDSHSGMADVNSAGPFVTDFF